MAIDWECRHRCSRGLKGRGGALRRPESRDAFRQDAAARRPYLLHALFECIGFAAEMREDFADEMKRTGHERAAVLPLSMC